MIVCQRRENVDDEWEQSFFFLLSPENLQKFCSFIRSPFELGVYVDALRNAHVVQLDNERRTNQVENGIVLEQTLSISLRHQGTGSLAPFFVVTHGSCCCGG